MPDQKVSGHGGGASFLLHSLRLGYLDKPLTQISSQPRGVSWLLRQEGLVLVRVLTPFLTPTALLVYRVFRNEAKRTTKILHGLLHGFAFIIALVGEFLGTALPPCLPGIPGGVGTVGAGTGAQKSQLVRFLLGHLPSPFPHWPILT